MVDKRTALETFSIDEKFFLTLNLNGMKVDLNSFYYKKKT
jgi:hypothetical protein